jgi:hypothetical protein
MAYAAQKTKTQYRKNQKRNAPKNQNKIPQKAKANLVVSIILCNFAP